jgi:phage protein U
MLDVTRANKVERLTREASRRVASIINDEVIARGVARPDELVGGLRVLRDLVALAIVKIEKGARK